MNVVTGTVELTERTWLTWEVDAKLLRVWHHTSANDYSQVVVMVPIAALRVALAQESVEVEKLVREARKAAFEEAARIADEARKEPLYTSAAEQSGAIARCIRVRADRVEAIDA